MSLSIIDKNHPSPAWLADLRRRFPTEREIDRVLTRKMERRAGGPFVPQTLAALVSGVESLLKSEAIGDFSITDARWLSGGASKLQMSFTLEWSRPGVGREATPMVLRMEPAESIVETSRLREFQLIKAFENLLPVPPVFWCDAEGRHLPYPALIYGFAAGVTKPAAGVSGVSGLGTHLGPRLRMLLAPQFIAHLATIHTHDFTNAGLTAFDIPAAGTESVVWGVNWWERVWEEDADEDVPLLRLAAGWLRANMPACERLSIVHADYRVGNFLFDEPSGRITALLDWELGRIGDRHQDLAWTASTGWSHPDEDGKTLLVCGLVPESQFFEDYERASGLSVDRTRLHYYKVYNTYMMGVLLLATGYRISRNGKTHQDVLVTWLMGIAYRLMDELRQLLEQGA